MFQGQYIPDDVYSTLTAEHVLPRTWSPKNAWRNLFPNRKAVDAHCHRLGNLTLMDKAENNNAGSSEFHVKCNFYKASAVDMTRALVNFDDWTQAHIEDRTEALIAALFEGYGVTKPR